MGKSCALPWGFSLYSWPYLTKPVSLFLIRHPIETREQNLPVSISTTEHPTMQQFKGTIKSNIDETDSPIIFHVLPSFQWWTPLPSNLHGLWKTEITCNQSLSLESVPPLAVHWKVANCPALTSTLWRRKKCGVFAVQRRCSIEVIKHGTTGYE